MDIVFLVAAVAAALLLPRPRALVATVGAWALCVAFVGWGPAKNTEVHTTSPGFWVPWMVVLVIGTALCLAISALRARRAHSTS